MSGKQQNERTEDVYNHLHEQTEHDDDTYDHACTAPNHGTDLSEYSHLRDIATVQSTSPFLDGGDYSTLGQWISIVNSWVFMNMLIDINCNSNGLLNGIRLKLT